MKKMGNGLITQARKSSFNEFFGFTPSIFYELETRFYKFLMNIKNSEKMNFIFQR